MKIGTIVKIEATNPESTFNEVGLPETVEWEQGPKVSERFYVRGRHKGVWSTSKVKSISEDGNDLIIETLYSKYRLTPKA